MTGFHPTYERLQRAMRKRNVSAPDLYGALGVSKQSYGHWKNRGVPDKHLLPIAKFLRCNADWIATGKGEMLEFGPPPPIHDASASALSEDALYVARVYMAAAPEMRRAWRLIAEDYISRLSPREQQAFRDALDEDLSRYKGVVRFPPADSA